MMYGKNYGKMSADDKMYQAQEDCRTLVEAYEIKADKTRYAAAMKAAKEKKKALDRVTGDMGKMGMGEYTKTRKKQMAKGGSHYVN